MVMENVKKIFCEADAWLPEHGDHFGFDREIRQRSGVARRA
jgi:hypothetical protein